MTWTLDEEGRLKVVWIQPKATNAGTSPAGRLTFSTKVKTLKPIALFNRTAALAACRRLRKSLTRGNNA